MPKSSSGIFHESRDIKDKKEIKFPLWFNNETAGGRLTNQEEFKVFRSWIPEENSYLMIDEEKFDKYWKNKIDAFSVINISDAIKQEILNIVPKIQELSSIKERIVNEYNKLQPENISESRLKGLLSAELKKDLYDYQLEAISNWEKNNYKGIVECNQDGKDNVAPGAVKSTKKG